MTPIGVCEMVIYLDISASYQTIIYLPEILSNMIEHMRLFRARRIAALKLLSMSEDINITLKSQCRGETSCRCCYPQVYELSLSFLSEFIYDHQTVVLQVIQHAFYLIDMSSVHFIYICKCRHY
jgi:hypothetical protein